MLFFGMFLLFFAVSEVLNLVVGLHATTIGAEILAVLGSAVAYRKIVGDSAADWPSLRSIGAGPVALLVLALTCVVLALTANGVVALVIEVVPGMQEIAKIYEEIMRELLFDATGLERVLGIISIVVFAPVCEEMLFRGTILQEQRKSEAFTAAVIINGFLFSLLHMSPVAFLSLWAVGAFFAHLTLRSESMLLPILAHAMFNAFNGVLLPEIAPQLAESEAPWPVRTLVLTLLVLVPVTAGLWALTTRLVRGGNEEEADT